MNASRTTLSALICTLCLSLGALADDERAKTASAADAAALAGGASRDLEKEFRGLDGNADGYLSKSEVPRKLVSGFESADKNSDGKLAVAEFQVLQAEASPDRSLASVSPTDPIQKPGR